ncbi:MAG: hypothetical protein NVSMB51_01370 [Solirubrobacteraceae bacterium]
MGDPGFTRTKLSIRRRGWRPLDERLGIRFPGLYERFAVWSVNLRRGSRLREVMLAHGFRRGAEA